MVDGLPTPSTVLDIAEYGQQNEAFATQAVYELFAQLRVQTTFPLMIAVDEWNECFPVSEYVSLRYDNTKYHGHIPAYHLTMPRAFIDWDGNRYKRGLKVFATSWKYRKRRDYDVSTYGIRQDEVRTLRNFSPAEFANYVAYYRLMNVIHEFPREKLEYFYLLTGGNGWESRRALSLLY